MRLLRLAANQPTFRTVSFNRAGISLITGEQRQPKSDQTGTYNGVGKSLLFHLLHYCLGANTSKVFKTALKDWVFHLTIEIGGREHQIARSASEPSEITLDEEKITLPKLRDWLEEACFELTEEIPFLTFRSIIRRFIRSGRDAYTNFLYASAQERIDPYGAMLRNAYLLGLDLQRAKNKRDLCKRKETLKKTMKQLEQEPLFADLLAKDKVDIELTALREQADKLLADLQAFRVAEDYHEIEREADEIKRRLGGLRRESVKAAEAIGQIDRSLRTKGDLPKERVFLLYSEAEKALPEYVQRKVEDVLKFQQELQQRRVFRLTRERQGLQRELSDVDKLVAAASRDFDAKLRFLSEHRALDEYLAVNNQLTEVRERIAKLENSSAIRKRVSRELKRIDRDLADHNIETDEYVSKEQALIDEASSTFRAFSKELYGARPSGLSISNDDGDNQLRYRIDAHITADAAEGINEAKIFCYDTTIATLRRGHSVDFLAHDTTLFGPVDPRQRLTMFRIADRVCRDQGLQYIAALNMHDITSMREQLEVDDAVFESLFGGERVVLALTDGSPKEKLLGIDVDMHFMD